MQLPKGKLAETVKTGIAEAGLLIRAALALSGVALLVACVALVMALRGGRARAT